MFMNSKTNITEANGERVKAAGDDRVRTETFYTSELGWSEDIWDLSGIAGGGPRLKGALIVPGSNHVPALPEQGASREAPSYVEPVLSGD